MSNYYQILNLESRQKDGFIQPHDVKTAYKRALLHHHPDKNALLPTRGANGQGSNNTVTVDDLTLAYKTISDPQLRAEYDRGLQDLMSNMLDTPNTRVHRIGLDTVDLDALSHHSNSQTWSKACRCGEDNGFVVREADLEEHISDGEITIGCKGCSLWLRVLFSVEDA